jgi:hypothetical protein
MDIEALKLLKKDIIEHKINESVKESIITKNTKQTKRAYNHIRHRFSCAIKKYKVSNKQHSTNEYLINNYGKKNVEFNIKVGMVDSVKKYGNEFIIIYKDETMFLQINNKHLFSWDMLELSKKSGINLYTLFYFLEKKKVVVSFNQRIKKVTGKLYDPGTYINIIK